MILKKFKKFKELKSTFKKQKRFSTFAYIMILATKTSKLAKWLSKCETYFPHVRVEGVVCENFRNNYFVMSQEPISLESIFVEVLRDWEEIHVLKQYWKAVDHAMLVSKTDTKGVITHVNETFIRISGYKYEELIGHPHNIVRHPDMPAELFKEMWETILSKKPWQGIIKNRAKNGDAYWVDATIYPILNRQGEIAEFIALRKDITPRMDAIERLETRERELQAILDHLDTVILFVSKAKGVLTVNHRFFEIFDYHDLEDFRSKHHCICELFLEEDRLTCDDSRYGWLDYISQKSQTPHKVKIKDKKGKIRTFLLKATPIDEKRNRSVLTLTDITQLEEALLEAKMGEHSKSLFVANMSHEIRTPLNGIIGFTELLLRKANDPQIRNYLQIVHQSSQTLLGIVNDILDLSKLESGKMALSPIAVNLVEELQTITAIFAAKAKEKHIDYAVFIDPRIPKSLLCDIQRLKQVIANLINNAIKFTPDGGEVIVDIEMKETCEEEVLLNISVQDSGIGISADKIKKIFDPFSQADDSISRQYGGTGLGLPISAKFVEMMGSRIEVDSIPQKGSDFHFELRLKVLDPCPFLDRMREECKPSIRYLAPLPHQRALFKTIEKYLKSWQLDWQLYEIGTSMPEDIDLLFVFDQEDLKVDCSICEKKGSPLHLALVEMEGEFESPNVFVRFHHLDRPIFAPMLWNILSIDREASDQQESEKSDKTLHHVPQFQGRVLVAEDNHVNQMLIVELLKERGVEVDLADNGEAAIEKVFKQGPYDLILMDVNMPGIDGIQAAKTLLEKGVKTPIVALTANVMAKERENYLNVGMRDHLGKPIQTTALDTVLQRYLQRKRADTKENSVAYDEVRYEPLKKAFGIDNEAVLDKLFEKFAEGIDRYIHELNDSIKKRDLKKVAETIHTIKGSSANMHFFHISEQAKKIEEMIKSDSSFSGIEKAIETLYVQLSDVGKKITDFLGQKE